MKSNLYIELTDRTKQIFKTVVETYLETGSPSGSETVLKKAGLDISSASVRSILSNLQKEGLLFSPHTSAGRVPTEKGMRFFVDGLLEFGRISKSEKENIEQLSSSKSKSYQEVLDEASRSISGLSNYAGIVIAPKYQKNLKHLEFIRLNNTQIMSILAYENGEIENRIIEDSGKFTNSQLLQTSNYLSEKFKNKNISEIKKIIESEIMSTRSNLEEISKKLVKKGIVEIEPKMNNPYIFLHGQSKLLKDEIISKDLDQIRQLFDDIENKSTFIDILENAGKAKGVQIFIGSKNFLFKHSGLSMVMAPYKNKEQEIVGAIGVVGPTRLNYSKIVPLVDYTSKIIGKVIK
ncbi:MAG: heat-inducible transcriptional repressor HrcA [Pelagibacteraceae bacterium]|jgi:heat-inducible transcriptional repressor|nr:heat-inducible transcriptional repressor HrcA [Pelagibacteraceae bacterium]MBT4646475.1 heat-inducible transcriptional repressor HrcA [Pelagibacteraceae bacterium]MBT5213949.1 heat-inducible transcriptional repressor HrcA [Pelagibacteraceae bacterium]MBT6197178.1 heat-inducible transcriptional repressor HrcA [Pelagibacteraceae bacterium]